MSAVEWSAVGLAIIFLCVVLRRHGSEIDHNRTDMQAVGGRVSMLETSQAKCQADIVARFKHGEEYFKDLRKEMRDLKKSNLDFSESVARLQTLTDGLAGTIRVIDSRVWHNRGGKNDD